MTFNENKFGILNNLSHNFYSGLIPPKEEDYNFMRSTWTSCTSYRDIGSILPLLHVKVYHLVTFDTWSGSDRTERQRAVEQAMHYHVMPVRGTPFWPWIFDSAALARISLFMMNEKPLCRPLFLVLVDKEVICKMIGISQQP
jgi:hypothetical protein